MCDALICLFFPPPYAVASSLGENSIGDAGAIAMAAKLEHNRTITSLK